MEHDTQRESSCASLVGNLIMALIAYEGFDHYATAASDLLSRRGGGLQWNTENCVFSSPGRNNSGTAVKIAQNNSLQGALSTALQSGYFGFGMLIETADANPSFQIGDLHGPGSITQVTFTLNIARAGIDIYREGVLIAATINNSFTLNVWNFVEVFIAIGNASGAIKININGQTVLNATGLDTQASPNAWWESMTFIGSAPPFLGGTSYTTMQIDDLYIADTTVGEGAFPFNNFAGDVKVVTLHTIGDAGTQGWTPLALTNWQEVSDVHSDGDASYNSTATAGAKDLFNFQPLDSTISVVLAVQVIGNYRKDDAGTRLLANRLVSGGTEVAGATASLPTNYVYVSDLYVVDPNGSVPWSVPAVNALQAGYTLLP